MKAVVFTIIWAGSIPAVAIQLLAPESKDRTKVLKDCEEEGKVLLSLFVDKEWDSNSSPKRWYDSAMETFHKKLEEDFSIVRDGASINLMEYVP